MYGFAGDDYLLNWIGEGGCTAILAFSMMAYAIFFHNVSPMKAVGGGMIAILTNIVKTLLNGDVDKLGVSAVAEQVNFMIHAIVCHALLTHTNYSTKAAYAYAIHCLLVGTQCFFATDSAINVWGLQNVSRQSKFKLQGVGLNCFALGIFIGGLAYGIEPTRACGYSMIPWLLNLIHQAVFSQKKLEEIGFKMNGIYAWITIIGVIVATLTIC